MSSWHELDDDARRLFIETTFEGATFDELLFNLPGRARDVERAVHATELLYTRGLIRIQERRSSAGWATLDEGESLGAIRSVDNWSGGGGQLSRFAVDITETGEEMMQDVNLRLGDGASQGLVAWDGIDGNPAGQMRMD